MRTLGFGVLLLALVSLGCSGSDGKLPISGTVQFQGKPLNKGTIQFHPVDQSGITTFANGEIKEGSYSIASDKGLRPGKYKVMISSADAKEKEPAAPGESGPPAKERIPKRYNSESQEFVEVKSGGDNKFNFDIK